MKNKYNEIMSRVKVTPQMHDRIMEKINETNFDEKNYNNWKSLGIYKKYIYVAASVLFLFAAVITMSYKINVDNKPSVLTVPDIREHFSAKELSSNVGYEVKEVKNIPFKVEKITYVSYWGKMSEITYSGENNVLVFRMATSDEDVSGNYDKYNDIKNSRTGSYNVTIKGNNGLYNLAIWQFKHFSYSLQIDQAITESELLNIVQSVQ